MVQAECKVESKKRFIANSFLTVHDNASSTQQRELYNKTRQI
jgi:hypothetical protein